MAKQLVPPGFVNAPSIAVYDAELPDALFRTYTRLRGLAWQSRYRETLPLTIDEVAEICHHNVRSMWGHLTKLRNLGYLEWHSVSAGRLVISFPVLQNFAVEPLQNFAVSNGGGVVVDHQKEQDQQQHHPPASGELQNFAVTASANFEALVAHGVSDGPMARQVAAMEHVTPELINAWAAHLSGLPGVRNLPGLLLYKLRTTQHGPPQPGQEQRGGRRSPAAAKPTPEDHQQLPDGLVEKLEQLGFRGHGPMDELAKAWLQDRSRVERWIEYVLGNGSLGPGYLLTALRSGDPAPRKRKRSRDEDRSRYISGKYADLIEH